MADTDFGASLALGTTWGDRGPAGAQGKQGWEGVGSLVTQRDAEAAPSSAPGAGGEDAPLIQPIESPPNSHQLWAKAAPGSKAQMAAAGKSFQS